MNEPAPDHFQTNLSVGEILRRTRLHYNQTLPDIERALRIRASQLEALETGNYALLPGRVYVIGFIRSYSEYLGLDGDKMVNLFKTQAGGRETPSASVNYPVMASDTKMPQIWQVVLSVGAVAAICVAWFSLQSEDRAMVTDIPAVTEQPAPVPAAREEIPPAPKPRQQAAAPPETQEAMPPQPAPVTTTQDAVSAEIAAVANETAAVTEPAAAIEPAAAAPAEQKAAAPAETQPAPPVNQKGVILNIRQNSWVEIRGKDGKSIVSRVLKAGDRYYVPDRPDLTISLGNSGGVEFEVEGRKLKAVGGQGEVKRNIPLDMAYLKKNYGQ